MRKMRTMRLWRRAERNARSASLRLMVQYERVVSGSSLVVITRLMPSPAPVPAQTKYRKSFYAPIMQLAERIWPGHGSSLLPVLTDSDVDSIAYDECEKMSSAA